MKVYFSGISGTGIGPLAEFAQDAGFEVCGSDLHPGAISDELAERKIEVHYGEQDGAFLQEKINEGAVDWFVYTSALPKDHPELKLAQNMRIKCSKRDEFIAEIVKQKNLKMIAVAGTHGKTTTTAMLIWTFLQMEIPVSYLVGTTLGWANSGIYDSKSEYFIYEADEYDRNFLAYHPYISVITVVDYDHPDIYPTREDYNAAFAQFESQSKNVVKNTTINERISLIGELRRKDGSAALEALRMVCSLSDDMLINVINRFPGVGRRFEEICEGVFSDYGHHPEEIRATVKMALELKERNGYDGLAIIYQPHQNTRQHKVRELYKDVFIGADKIFWLPTYLTREDPKLKILEPHEIYGFLNNATVVEEARADEKLAKRLHELRDDNWLIVLLTAGPADTWLRDVFKK